MEGDERAPSGQQPDAEGQAVARARAALGGRKGFETRRQKQQIAARLFGRAPTPVSLDRYTVLREIGAGGMGMVYLGYDDQLDRRVAIKLLRGSRADEEAQSRLQREAQAMARLSHPNVVTVYEVGRLAHELYVVMEYVKGGDLRAWLEAEPRPCAQVLALFVQAGAGLVAAHSAGIVHRDFKPDNVLVGIDGRARVADFGLAAGQGAPGELRELPAQDPEASALAETASSSQNQLEVQLTRTGALMGTPAYMAPEQYAGATTDARSDQFSFCVALWEGLYGQRPFVGDTMLELAFAVKGGQVSEPPPERAARVPSWLRAVLERGLAVDPRARWPSMEALLAALGDDPLARRRRWRRRAALTGLTAAVIAALATTAVREVKFNARQRYWNGLTESLLDIERARGLQQARDDAERARDTTRLGAYRRYQVELGQAQQRDPTVAAMLLAEVGAERRASEAWISAANMSLGRPSSYARLRGHADTVRAIVLSPDGQRVYSAAADGEVRSWELSNAAGRSLYRHGGPVTTLVVSPDGETLVSVAEDGSALAWDTAGGAAAPRRLALFEAGITSADFDATGGKLVLASRDHSARIIELASGASQLLEGHAAMLHAARFDPSGTRVATGADDGELRVWDAADGRLLAAHEAHARPVFHLGFVDRERLVSGADDGSVRGWVLRAAGDELGVEDGGLRVELPAGSQVSALAIAGTRVAVGGTEGEMLLADFAEPTTPARRLADHAAGVWSLAFSAEQDALFSASFDTTARVTPLDGAATRVFRGHRDALWRLALGPRGRWLVTGGFDSELRVWDLSRPALERALEPSPSRVFDLASEGGRIVVAGARNAQLFDAQRGVELASLPISHSWNAAAFIPGSSQLALGSNAGRLVLWEPSAGEAGVRTLDGHRAAIRDLALSSDGERLASASSDHEVHLWQLQAGTRVVLEGHRDKVLRVSFDPSGRRLASTSLDGALRVWGGSDGRALAVFEGHTGPVRALAAHPQGRGWATGSDDGSARLWPDDDAGHALTLAGHSGRVVALSYDASGERLLTCSSDHTVRVWGTQEGNLLDTLVGHQDTVWGAHFLDAERVISHADDNTIRIWRLGSARASIVLRGHSEAVAKLALGQGWFVSAAAGGRVKLWRLAGLSDDPLELGERLAAATISCLDVRERELDLGEDPQLAARAFAACERERGRGR